MRSTRPKSRIPVSTNTNTNQKMAVASLPSTYTKFPLRILNKGPDFFRDQVVHDRGHSSQKSAAERLAESRTQYVKSYNRESDSREKAVHHKGVSKETTHESVPRHSSPKKRSRNEQKLKLHTAQATVSDTSSSKPATEHGSKRSDATESGDSRRNSEFEEEMKGVGNLICHYQQRQDSPSSGSDKKPEYIPKKSRSPPQIPKKPKRCVSPGNRSCGSDDDDVSFKRISVKQAAKSWENVSSGMMENYRLGFRKHRSGDDIDSSQRSPESNGCKLKTSNIAKAWERLAADIEREENGKRYSPPPKVKLVDEMKNTSNSNSNNSSFHHAVKTSAVKVKLTDSGAIPQQEAILSKPVKVQLINTYNAAKSQDGEQSQPPIRATVKVVDNNMNTVTVGSTYERKDPKRAIRAKVEQVKDFSIGKANNFSSHVSKHDDRPTVKSQISNQSEATTDSNLSAKVRLLLVQSKENLTNTDCNQPQNTTTLNNVTNNESPTRGRSKSRKIAAEKTKNIESSKENNYRGSKHSPQHHGRSKSSGPMYRMHLGSSQDSGHTYSHDSAKNTQDTSSPARSSSPALGSPKGSRIRKLQEQLMALCDTEDSSSFDSPESLGDGRFVRSRSCRSYSKEELNDDVGIPRRGSAPVRQKGREREHSPKKEKKASAKENVIVERRDMPVPSICTTKKSYPEKIRSSRSAGKNSPTHVQRKDTKSSFDSMDAKISASETTGELKDVFEKTNTELFIVERPSDLITSPVKSYSPGDRSNVDSPSSSLKEKYSRMTTIMLGSGEIGAIDNLPISVDVEVEYDDAFDHDDVNKQSSRDHNKRQFDVPKADTKDHHHRHRTEHIKRTRRKYTQTSTDSEDIPSTFVSVSRDKSSPVHETSHIDTPSNSKHQRRSARESKKKVLVYEDIDSQQSADQIKSCHSPNLNNNRAAEGFHRGSQMRRSCSDLDPPYLNKAHSELDRFFDQMGLEESVLKRMDSYQGVTDEDAFHPMHEMKYYDSDSVYSNESDNLSHGSKVSDDGLLRRHLTSRLPDQSMSIVMRNARVIKWLCQCRKARTQSVS